MLPAPGRRGRVAAKTRRAGPPLRCHEPAKREQPGGALHQHAHKHLPPCPLATPVQTWPLAPLIYLLLHLVQERRKARAPTESHGNSHCFHLPGEELHALWLSVFPSYVFWNLEIWRDGP